MEEYNTNNMQYSIKFTTVSEGSVQTSFISVIEPSISTAGSLKTAARTRLNIDGSQIEKDAIYIGGIACKDTDTVIPKLFQQIEYRATLL